MTTWLLGLGALGVVSVLVAVGVGRMFAMAAEPTTVEQRRALLDQDEDARRRRAIGRVWW